MTEPVTAVPRSARYGFGAGVARSAGRGIARRGALARVGDPEVAADLTAETFAAALASAHPFDPGLASPGGVPMSEMRAMDARHHTPDSRFRSRVKAA